MSTDKVTSACPTGVAPPMRENMSEVREVAVRETGADGLSIFDGSPTGGFTIAMRGYDRVQVEQHVRQLEATLAQTRGRANELDKQVVRLRQELAEASTELREVERPTYSGLGARIEQLLRLAEE